MKNLFDASELWYNRSLEPSLYPRAITRGMLSGTAIAKRKRMIRNMRGVAAIICVGCVGLMSVGCGPTGILDSGRRFEVKLTVDRLEARVAEDFTFRLDAQGSGLSDVTFTWGDGQLFVFLANGATTVGLAQKHAYAAAGTYRIEGIARLASGETLSDHLDVVVRAALP